MNPVVLMLLNIVSMMLLAAVSAMRLMALKPPWKGLVVWQAITYGLAMTFAGVNVQNMIDSAATAPGWPEVCANVSMAILYVSNSATSLAMDWQRSYYLREKR